MNFNKINSVLENENLIFKPISSNDKRFINKLFQDSDMKKFYIVSKDTVSDYRSLVDYWIKIANKKTGLCWMIYKKNVGFFSKSKVCGFITFEYSENTSNVRITYAIDSNFRNKGIATASIKYIIDKLKSEGIKRIEADIDRENTASEEVVKKLGFSNNRKIALLDPKVKRNGKIIMRSLWKKDLVELNRNLLSKNVPLNFSLEKLALLIEEVAEESKKKGSHPLLYIRYYYLLGRLRYTEGNIEEAQQAFGQSNMIAMQEGIPAIYEIFYWFGKIYEINDDYESAKTYYQSALSRFNPDLNYISKELIENELNKEVVIPQNFDFHLITNKNFDKFITERTTFHIQEEEEQVYFNFSQPMGKYNFVLKTTVTEKLVGISNDNFNTYYVPWELLREEKIGGKSYMIFCGWGDDVASGGHAQFDYYEVGVEKSKLKNVISRLMYQFPNLFPTQHMKNVIGLEDFGI